MKVIITKELENKITVTEELEPTSPYYIISQKGRKIYLTEYQIKELIRALKFISRNE